MGISLLTVLDVYDMCHLVYVRVASRPGNQAVFVSQASTLLHVLRSPTIMMQYCSAAGPPPQQPPVLILQRSYLLYVLPGYKSVPPTKSATSVHIERRLTVNIPLLLEPGVTHCDPVIPYDVA